MDRSVKVRHLPPFSGRTIVISDIHGCLEVYRKLLAKVKYQPGTDRILLLGDLVEKGPDNLDTLHFIMNQVQHENVHCLMGNCDFTAKNVLFSYRLDFIRNVVSSRRSLITEMADQIGIDMLAMDMDDFCQQIRRHFLDELSFLADLPHVLLDEKRIYTHAAIMNETTFGDDFRQTMTTPFFADTAARFSRPVVCGHLPVSEYCQSIASFDVLWNPEKNIYSIDGGNIVKRSGQLNALIFEADGSVSTNSADLLPLARAVHTVTPKRQLPFYLTWNRGQITILDAHSASDQVLAHSAYLRRTFWIDRAFVKDGRGTEYTNYQMPLKKGDIVSVTDIYGDKVQIKKGGRLGWAFACDLEMTDVS